MYFECKERGREKEIEEKKRIFVNLTAENMRIEDEREKQEGEGERNWRERGKK